MDVAALDMSAAAQAVIVPPKGAVTFNPFNAIPLPSPASGENTLFTFQVPIGYDGIITGQSNGYIGAGFIEGSGDIVWRIVVNNFGTRRYLKDCGAILVSLGKVNLYQTIPGGMRIYSGNAVSVVVTAPNTSGALPPAGTGQIFAGLHGYHWPRR
jgi:hypothetical protein